MSIQPVVRPADSAAVMTRLGDSWSPSELPGLPGTVIQYRNAAGHRVVAAADVVGSWTALTIDGTSKVSHWSAEALLIDMACAAEYQILPDA